jgi:hypothetical protein
MQLVVDAGKAVNDTSSPNAATTDRKERRAKAKEKAKAEGRKEGAAYAAPPASPDSQASEGGKEDGSEYEPNESQQLAEDEASQGKEDIADGMINEAAEAKEEVRVDHEARVAAAIRQEAAEKQSLADLMPALAQRADELATARLAADDYAQDSEDTKEEGETGDEEQEAEEKDGDGKGQAGPAPLARESGGGCALSFSSSPVDRAHHSPRGKRRMSDEEEQEELMRVKTPLREDVPQLEQYGSGGEGGEREEGV